MCHHFVEDIPRVKLLGHATEGKNDLNLGLLDWHWSQSSSSSAELKKASQNVTSEQT